MTYEVVNTVVCGNDLLPVVFVIGLVFYYCG